MSIFDRIRSKMTRGTTASSSSSSSSASSSSSSSSGGAYQLYEISLTEFALGVHIEPVPNDGRPRVCGMEPASPGARLGLMVGDIFAGIEGNPVASYADFVQALQTFPRPVRISFYRFVQGSAASAVASAASLSTDEKERRREAMVAAALAREKTWDKKVQTAKGKRDPKTDVSGRTIYDHTALAEIGASNPETQRMVALAKQNEQRTVAQLGYDPFKPALSSSSNTAGVGVLAGHGQQLPPPMPSQSLSSAPPSLPAPGSPGSRAPLPAPPVSPPRPAPAPVAETGAGDLEAGEAHPALVEAVNAAMQQLLDRTGAEDGERVQTALTTVEKMLAMLHGALATGADPSKFRSVRMGNAAFQSKVASVVGGTELMLAAGFVLVEDASPAGNDAAAAAPTAATETFLRHSTEPLDRVKLNYTLARLRELL